MPRGPGSEDLPPLSRAPAGRVGILLVALFLLVPTGLASAPSPGTAPVAPSSAFSSLSPAGLEAPVLSGAPSSAQGYARVGPVPAGTELTTVVGIASSDSAGLTAYADRMPSVPPLTSAQVFARFGPSPASLSALRTYLESAGLSVRAPSNGWDWLVTGPAGSFEQAFSTSLAYYRPAGGSSPVAVFTRAPSVPVGLPLSAIASPSPVPLFQNALVQVASPSTSSSAGPGQTCPTAGLTPSVVQGAYSVTPEINAGNRGQGVTIGIVDTYDPGEQQPALLYDLQTFSQCFGLPSPSINFAYPVPGGDMNLTTSSNGWGLETALDTQWAHASAPDASLELVLSPNSGYGLYYGLDYLVSQDQVGVISLSWGESEQGIYNGGPCSFQCNASTDGSFALLGPAIAAAAAEGIDVFAASGDCGANGGTSQFSPWYPASDPFAIGVGGTQLNVSGTSYLSETAWSGTQTSCQNQGGSGGGFSLLSRPSWQVGPGFSRFPSQLTRGVPDVALVAGTALGIVYQGASTYVEGTSDAAPQWAGYAALFSSAEGASHPGFLAPRLYAVLNSSQYASAFHPITTGWNGYTAAYGWNPVTGIGTPDFSNLVSDLLAQPLFPSVPSPSSIALRASPQAGVAPLAVSFSASPSNYSTYQFAFGDVGPPYGEFNASTTSQSSTVHLYSSPGAFVAFSAGFGPKNASGISNAVVINVGNAGPLTVSVSATPSGAPAGSPVTITASASGGTAPYAFSYYFGDGTSQSGWGSSGPSTTHTYARNGSYLLTVVANDSSSPQRGGQATACVVVGGGAPTCPSLLPPLVVAVRPQQTVLTAGSTTPVVVQVTENGIPVVATLSVSVTQGTLSSPGGQTNASGELTVDYTAPYLHVSSLVDLYANATNASFSPGSGQATLTVNPLTGPSLSGSLSLASTSFLSGSTQAVLGGEDVLLTGQPAPGVVGWLNTSLGTTSAPTLLFPLTAPSLAAATLYVDPVAAPSVGTLTLQLRAPGYSGSNLSLVFTAQPLPAGTSPLSANVSATDPVASLAPLALRVNLTSGSPVSPPQTTFSLDLDGHPVAADFSPAGTGSWRGLTTAPATNVDTMAALLVNASAPGYAPASAYAITRVEAGGGPLALAVSPTGSWTTSQSLTLSFAVTSARFPGTAVGGAALVISLSSGTPTTATLVSDANGSAELSVQAPGIPGTVTVEVVATVAPYSESSFNFSFAVHTPSFSSLLEDVLLFVVLPVGLILGIVVVVLRRRPPRRLVQPQWVGPWQPPPSSYPPPPGSPPAPPPPTGRI